MLKLNSNLLLSCVLIVQVIGFVLLWQQNNSGKNEVTANMLSEVPKLQGNIPNEIAVSSATRASDDQLLAQIREIIRQEVEAAIQQNQPRQQDSDRTLAADFNDNLEAFAQSSTIIEDALSSGVWKQDNNNAILQHASKLTLAQRVELLDKISGAINQGMLDLEATPPPL